MPPQSGPETLATERAASNYRPFPPFLGVRFCEIGSSHAPRTSRQSSHHFVLTAVDVIDHFLNASFDLRRFRACRSKQFIQQFVVGLPPPENM